MVNLQQNDDWKQERVGHVTASRVADLMAKTKTGPAASRENYMASLVLERLTNTPESSFTSAAMQWGIDTEAQARAVYEMETGIDVAQVGFIRHPGIEWFGCSPDGLVAHDGLTEFKCPNSSTHLDFLLTGKIDKKYMTQMCSQMSCTGRLWCDFVSFDPRMPQHLQIKIIRVARDDVFVSEVEREVVSFLVEVDAKIKQLEELK